LNPAADSGATSVGTLVNTTSGLSPAGVAVPRHQAVGKEQNSWQGKVSAVDLMGDRVRVHIDGTPAIEPAAITTYPQ
jgi:hypothetical protein